MATSSSRDTQPKVVKTFHSRIRAGLKRCRLAEITEAEDPLLVGFSGGADSTALLLALSGTLTNAERLVALHVHHGLRPKSADRDAEHAERLCRERGIRFRLEKVQVKASGRGLEADAREARRRVFRAAARYLGTRVIFLAHTRNDQAETILMRLFEGSGISGLAGMSASAPLGGEGEDAPLVLRPMLDIEREDVLAYLDARGVSWVEDETNEDESRLRNLIRKKVLPAVTEALGAAPLSGITASAAHLEGAAQVVKDAVAAAAHSLIGAREGTIRVEPLSQARLLPKIVRMGLWREALERAREKAPARSKRRPLKRLLESIDRLALEEDPSAKRDMPGGLEARREYDLLLIGEALDASAPPESEASLEIPGTTLHADLGIALEASKPDSVSSDGEDAMTAWLDERLLGGRAVVRTRREGDRFRPSGSKTERKLKEFLIQRKVPLRIRESLPLVAVGSEVAWVIGHGVSEKFMPRSGKADAVKIRAYHVKSPHL